MSNIPQLRFSEFSGNYPKKKLGEIFFKKQERNKNDEIKNVLTNSAVEGIVNQQDFFDKEIANQNNLTNYFVVDVDDFIYNPRISRFAPVGPLNRNTLQRGIMSPLYTVLQPKVGNLSYLESYFKTKKWHKYMYKIANYGARHDRMNILNNDFMKLPVPFPSLPEQQKIASFLESVDSYINNLKSQKESLEKYKKGMMQKIFAQEIRFKDENGKDFPEWDEKRLSQIATFAKGKGISKDDIVDDGKYECIRYGELYTQYKEVIKKIYSRTNILPVYSFLSQKGDVVIPASGEISLDIATTSCVQNTGILLGGDINIIRFYKEQEGVFFAYYLKNHKKRDIAKLAQGQSVVHLYSSQLRGLKINIPSLPEQQKIASFFSSIDEFIQLKTQQIKKAEEWKKGLMQGLFV